MSASHKALCACIKRFKFLEIQVIEYFLLLSLHEGAILKSWSIDSPWKKSHNVFLCVSHFNKQNGALHPLQKLKSKKKNQCKKIFQAPN